MNLFIQAYLSSYCVLSHSPILYLANVVLQCSPMLYLPNVVSGSEVLNSLSDMIPFLAYPVGVPELLDILRHRNNECSTL